MARIKPKGATITYEDATTLLSQIPHDSMAETYDFLRGEHWRKQKGWNGYVPDTDTTKESLANYTRTMNTIERAFTPKNVVGGVINRLVGAILGKQPDWAIVSKDSADPTINPKTTKNQSVAEPTKNEKKFKEIDNAMVKWWDNKKIHETLKKFAESEPAYGLTGLRLYIPTGYLDEKGNLINSKTFEEIIDKFYLEVPDKDCFIDAKDDNYGNKYTVLEIKPNKDDLLANESLNSPEYEVCYIDENKKTVYRKIKQNQPVNKNNEAQPPLDTITKDLGGNPLTLSVGSFDRAKISQTVKAQQKTVNSAKTGEVLAGNGINFPDTTFFNVDMPTETRLVEDKIEEVPKKMSFGPGNWRNLWGVIKYDAEGSESRETPSMVQKDGADPSRFATIAENNAKDIHQEVGMGYIYMSQNPYPSGESRIESMSDYLILLVDQKTLVDTVGVWLLQTVIRLAFNFTKETELNDEFNVIFNSKITLGRISVEDKRLMLDEVLARVRSVRSYQIIAEVTDDPNSEDKYINLEANRLPPMDLEMQMKQLESAEKAQKQLTEGDNADKPKPKADTATA
jgi:hypothetical protein